MVVYTEQRLGGLVVEELLQDTDCLDTHVTLVRSLVREKLKVSFDRLVQLWTAIGVPMR